MLADHGAVVVDTDAIAHEIEAPGQPALAEIVAAFGPQVLAADGSLDRAALGAVVFADPAARRRLEGITHPRIRVEWQRRVAAARVAGAPACVVDVPLLFEAGLDGQGLFDEIWVVSAPASVQLVRLQARNALSREQAQCRLTAQWPLPLKVERADRVIDNGGSLQTTREQVDAAWTAALAGERPS